MPDSVVVPDEAVAPTPGSEEEIGSAPDESLATAESLALPTPLMEDGSATGVNSEVLEKLVRELLTPETVGTLTKKLLRQSVAKSLSLDDEGVEQIRQPLSDLVDTIMNEFNAAEQPEARSPRKVPRKRRAPTAHSDSEYNSGESAGEDSDDEPKSAKRQVGMRKAQSSAMTRSYFLANAKAYKSNLGPIEFELAPREYGTGSCGWFFGAKKELEVGEKTVMCQITVNCTVLGSKGWKKEKLEG